MVQAAQGLGDVAMVLAAQGLGDVAMVLAAQGLGDVAMGTAARANQRAGWAEGREAKSGFPALVENGFACPAQRPRLMISC
jgi:hypothetical protein